MAVRDPLVAPAARGPLTQGQAAAEAIAGHRFQDPALLQLALTHRSAAYGHRSLRPGDKRGEGSNERLEFVGDRVLGLLIAEWLLERYPAEQEGELGPRLARLVSRPVLAEIADRVGLPGVLAVSPNESRAGVHQLATVLGDAMEALIGAIYIDGGLDPARAFVRRAWGEHVAGQASPPKDPKTVLQEWFHARAMAGPDYELVSREGPPHAPRFVMRVRAGVAEGQGESGSKQDAQRIAAAALLEKLGL